MISKVFVFIVNFLLLIVRFLQDLLWLKDYCLTLTNSECIKFILLLLLYTLFWRALLACFAYISRKLLGSIEFIDNFLQRRLFLNSDYCNGYENGYAEGVNSIPKTLWQRIKSWF